MRPVTSNEYKEISDIFQKEMKAIALHEGKNSWYGGVPKKNCFVRKLDESILLYQMFTPAFVTFISEVYLNALNNHQELFGTGNAKDVIHALYLESNARDWDEERYIEYLSNEIFCLLICKNKDSFCKDVLRIDLFRKLDKSKKVPGSYEFTGGLYHALKHFSIEKKSASILPNQKVDLYDIEQLIWPIAHAFYRGTWSNGNRKNTYETSIIYLDKTFTLKFYKEDSLNVSFINSVIPRSI